MVGLDSRGVLVLQDKDFNTIWACEVGGGDRVFMQTDGNLIIRNRDGRALWVSETSGNDGSILVVDDAGRVAVMNDETPIWLSGIPRGRYTGPSSTDLSFPARGIFYYPW